MKHVSRNLILSLGIVVPTISAPAMTLTSCSTIWGYNTPIHFGSSFANNANNPFYNFNGQTILDNNGNNIAAYLQTDYTIDAKSSVNYAYSAPITKWLYSKDDEEAKKAGSQVMPINKWESNKLGWMTSSSTEFSDNAQFVGTLANDKYVRAVNNENVILAANVNFTAAIASAITSYFSGALKYQASQINKDNDNNLNIAWGSAINYSSINDFKFNHGKKGTEGTTEDIVNNIFYEYIFSQANAHGISKGKKAKDTQGAFLRTTNVGFNYDTFPIPSYYFANNNRVDISLLTKQLLMGTNNVTQDTKFCEAGLNSANPIPAYYTKKADGTLEMTIGDDSNKNPVNVKLNYTDYYFDNVPIIVTANNVTQTWVNPTIKDSFHVSDFYVDSKEKVKSAIGNFTNIENYATHPENQLYIKEYTFDTAPAGGKTKVQAVVKPTEIDSVGRVDTRIVKSNTENKINGNKFIVLVSYIVREYDNNKHIYSDLGSKTPTEYISKTLKEQFAKIGKTMTDEEIIAWLRSRNIVTLSGETSIFPAYFLNLSDKLFKKAYTEKDENIKEYGYTVNPTTIDKYCDELLGIFGRSNKEGYKSFASDLTQDSKNLLGFLRFMFGAEGESQINLLEDALSCKWF